jgi:hypothetical protein
VHKCFFVRSFVLVGMGTAESRQLFLVTVTDKQLFQKYTGRCGSAGKNGKTRVVTVVVVFVLFSREQEPRYTHTAARNIWTYGS